jgi:hypothetical protein
MADTLEVDSGWVVKTLNTICTEQARASGALLNIDEHLKQQNKAIEKGQVRGVDHELRLSGIERNQKTTKKRWAMILDVVLKLMVAIAAPLMLLHVFGIM